jgi:hypothetical protein
MLPETDDILPRLDTVRWMAPELLDPEPYLYLQSSEEGARTKTSDLYALAMTMWEVSTLVLDHCAHFGYSTSLRYSAEIYHLPGPQISESSRWFSVVRGLRVFQSTQNED